MADLLKRTKQSREEQGLAKAVADLLTVLIPEHVGFWSHIGHGGGGQLRGSILKGMGLKAGLPDYYLTHSGNSFWIELKTPTGAVSKEQRKVHRQLTDHGAQVGVCRSINDVKNAVNYWGFDAIRTGSRGAVQT